MKHRRGFIGLIALVTPAAAVRRLFASGLPLADAAEPPGGEGRRSKKDDKKGKGEKKDKKGKGDKKGPDKKAKKGKSTRRRRDEDDRAA